MQGGFPVHRQTYLVFGSGPICRAAAAVHFTLQPMVLAVRLGKKTYPAPAEPLAPESGSCNWLVARVEWLSMPWPVLSPAEVEGECRKPAWKGDESEFRDILRIVRLECNKSKRL